jgi:hypothetical protein
MKRISRAELTKLFAPVFLDTSVSVLADGRVCLSIYGARDKTNEILKFSNIEYEFVSGASMPILHLDLFLTDLY